MYSQKRYPEFSLASPPHFNSKTCCVSLDMVLTLWPLRWPTFTFSLYYHPWIKHEGQENKGRDHQLKKRLIIKQILLVSTLGNVKRTVWTICILMLGRKGLEHSILMVHLLTQCNSKRRIVSCITKLASSERQVVLCLHKQRNENLINRSQYHF